MATISKIQAPLVPRVTGQDSGETPAQTGKEQRVTDQGRPDLPARQDLDMEEINAFVKDLQTKIDEVYPEAHRVGFHQEPGSDAYVIEIIDSEGRMIKQFPPEKVLNLRRKLAEFSGMVIDKII